jgi:lipid II:glycine glycyltransferase (peptidoglycan interpeptide bridge formation enzyme)
VLETTLRARLEAHEAAEYDAFVATARAGSFAQLRDYEALATSDRPFTARYFLARDGAKLVGTALVLRSRLARLPLPFAQVERGPVVDDLDRLPEVVRALRRTLALRGVARLAVMPYVSGDDRLEIERGLSQQRFRPVDDPAGSHVLTLRMPIDAPKVADVYSGSFRKTLRYELKHAEKAGVVCARARGDDALAFVRLSQTAMAAQGKTGKSDAFGRALSRVTLASDRIAVFVAREGDQPIGAVVMARTDSRLTLLLGATSLEKKPYSKMSPPLAEAIAWGRSLGAKELDLGGIPRRDDPDTKRKAIAAFKYGFSRDEVDLVREHVRWL